MKELERKSTKKIEKKFSGGAGLERIVEENEGVNESVKLKRKVTGEIESPKVNKNNYFPKL